MANSPYKTNPSDHRLTVSSLLSPPEMKRSESFGSSIAPAINQSPFSSFNSAPVKPGMDNAYVVYQAALQPHGDAYASPPISPYDPQSQKENMEVVESQDNRDPQLFASGAVSVSGAEMPLFPKEPSTEPSQDAIAAHMQSQDYAKLESKPSREDYELVVAFRSTVYNELLKDPRSWWVQERKYDSHYGRPNGIQKRPALKKLAPAPSSRPRQPKVALARMPPRTPRAPKAKRTPVTQIHDSFDSTPMSASPKPARPATNRDDIDYNAVPDYSPPLDTLPKGNSKVLKAEWKGTQLDLSQDPDRHLLHEAELHLASTLRLSCATYLCSKRRIFVSRIETMRIGKEFRKTDAQQACKIDVNKASKLWQAYDRVGWFEPHYFQQYL